MQEQEVIEKIRAGDRSAFQEFFETYKTMVFNVCFRMLGNRQEAEDVTQEVFFKAYKSLKHFRSESRLSTWLYRIAVNLSLNLQRKKKRVRWLSLDFIFETESEQASERFADANDDPEALLEKGETERMVQNAINSLPKQQRIALILHRYEGLPYQEIAEVMHCSVASVESRLHRAKENLSRQLLPLIKQS